MNVRCFVSFAPVVYRAVGGPVDNRSKFAVRPQRDLHRNETVQSRYTRFVRYAIVYGIGASGARGKPNKGNPREQDSSRAFRPTLTRRQPHLRSVNRPALNYNGKPGAVRAERPQAPLMTLIRVAVTAAALAVHLYLGPGGLRDALAHQSTRAIGHRGAGRLNQRTTFTLLGSLPSRQLRIEPDHAILADRAALLIKPQGPANSHSSVRQAGTNSRPKAIGEAPSGQGVGLATGLTSARLSRAADSWSSSGWRATPPDRR